MNITCRSCGTLLKRTSKTELSKADFVGAPWYVDEKRMRHLALVCLHCGTLHDCLAAQKPAIFTALMSPLKINMIKVTATLNIQEVAQRITSQAETGVQADASDHGIPAQIVQALQERQFLPQK